MIIKIEGGKSWNVSGVNLIPSDSSYQLIKGCIQSGDVTEKKLQRLTGHRLPIDVNIKKRSINFHNLL